MSRFFKYQHVARFGHPDVDGIEDGICHVFPKLDGTNASVWLENGTLQAGSRRRHLTELEDNHGFCKWINEKNQDDPLFRFLQENPELHLFGEWLVPHTLKTYRDDAWRKFYIFDVMFIHPRTKTLTIVDERRDPGLAERVAGATGATGGEIVQTRNIDAVREIPFGPPPEYLPYDEYQPLLEKFGLDYIPRLAVTDNASKEQFLTLVERNDFLMQPGEIGEGIVIKNYCPTYKNQYGRMVWAKMVRSEFHEKNMKEWKSPVIKGAAYVEKEIADECVTKTLVEKERAKIDTTPIQPRLLNTIYHCVVTEELWNQLKKRKNPTIDFKTLQRLVYTRVKSFASDLFRR